jgi:hypothetical protein
MERTITRPARTWAYSVLAGLVIMAGAGCGQQLTKVRGKVTLDGKPLDAAGVQFHPIGGRGMPANGITDGEGTFFVDTHSRDDGAWPGEYKVVISKYEVDPLMQPKIDSSDPKSMANAYARAAKAMAKPKKYLVPKVYLSPETTPLRWKVPDDNNKTLELTNTAK